VTRCLRALWALPVAAALHTALAGEAITAFQQGKPLPAEALQHTPVKGVIAEFLDPDKLAVGKEISYLLWREMLTAISDQSGAGVIIAHPPGQERLVDLIQRDYHEAAIAIAQSQKARMAVWGVVGGDESLIFADTYLSMVGEAQSAELALRLYWGYEWGSPETPRDSGFAARLWRTRFNFPRTLIARDMLFRRPLTAQVKAAVRERPGAGATLATAAQGDPLQAEDMQGSWFRVRLADGRAGWIDSGSVYAPPRYVDARDDAPLRAAQKQSAAASAFVQKGTRLEVLQMRFVASEGLWYRVSAPQGEGWIPAWAVWKHFTFPVVHFAAGLYRYQLGRYAESADEFEEYVHTDGVEADAPSLSSAYQMLAASHLMRHSKNQASQALAAAARATPFDPGIYTLRALSMLVDPGTLGGALPELQHALELDADSADARGILAGLGGLLGDPDADRRLRYRVSPAELSRVRAAVAELTQRYTAGP
jgi:SH3-like domain-containing protein